MSPLLPLLAALVAAPPQLDLASAAVDPTATANGLRARAGADLDGWTITVRDTAAANRVEATLRSPTGDQRRRRLVLTGTTTADRSRELAAALALLLDEEDDPRAAPPPKKTADRKPAPQVRGWLGLGPRLEVGAPAAGGLDLVGGAWLLRDHLQPLANLTWAYAASHGLRMHSLRFGGGLAAGSFLPRRPELWLGGHALLHAQRVQARDALVASAWTGTTELGALLQVRWSRVLLAARTGVDLDFPPLTVRGTAARISRGPAAWVLAVNFGFVFG